MNLSYAVAARMGAVAAAYALEHLGAQSHAYTWEEFKRRYAEHFEPLELAEPVKHS
jgi:adenosine kinase